MKRIKKTLGLFLAAALLLGLPSHAEDVGGGESGDPQTGIRCVALTFDDGPTGSITTNLLAGLRERYVSATFFLCGYRVEQYPEIIREMAVDGHELGLHGCSHTFMDRMSKAQIRDELEGTSAMIAAITGQAPRLFRPPGGLTSKALLEETTRLDLPIILWNLDPEDWKYHDVTRIVNQVVKKAKDGDIILMHDLSNSSVQAAFQIIDALQAQGFEFCTVSELAAARSVTLEASKKYGHLLF